ncbi:TatD family hydrolase [Helicobacter bizzozeronii]|uniref:TatD family hydrolase n=1 Tax=Helicobacter bizzozeronii TaxID=56877 RepID=UPI000CF1B8A3|nr:TatD family hydrolase [Helicobacter bizzozeronii]
MLIDTHCHLDHALYESDLQEVLKSAREVRVNIAIIPGADPQDLKRAIALSESHAGLYFAVGVHPLDQQSFDLGFLKEHIQHPKCVAVGECGLDYHRLENQNPANQQAQQGIFRAQIGLALEYSKPLIVHIREASLDAYQILKSYPNLKGVLHCYNADEVLLGLSSCFYFGIGGVATFKNAKNLVGVLPKIPLDRLLLETDAPYLTPHPFRGQRNEPKHIALIAQKIAHILEMEPHTLAQITTQNAQNLFGCLKAS